MDISSIANWKFAEQQISNCRYKSLLTEEDI